MLKKRRKKKERREAVGEAKKHETPQGQPWEKAGTAEPDLNSRTDTNSLSIARAQSPEAPPPPPRSPAPSSRGSQSKTTKTFNFSRQPIRRQSSHLGRLTAPAQTSSWASSSVGTEDYNSQGAVRVSRLLLPLTARAHAFSAYLARLSRPNSALELELWPPGAWV